MWAVVLKAAILAAHWGAEHLAKPLKKLRKRWGFSVTASSALLGLAAASAEIGMNVASAVRGVADIGLGTMLGSNVIAIPYKLNLQKICDSALKVETVFKI
ncbi:hypothetical protein [Pontibacter akesuensis]|uniref:hypothetical protein n=1 Tax=Pontibacter akesuensis TaxID=388950 RepID=UPI0021D208E5|nr:hypothetical protein [Pontibacter akesuensis]